MARAYVEDPLKVFRFQIAMDGLIRGGFNQCTGVEATAEVAEYREGGDQSTVQKSSGLITYGNITFMRGVIVGSLTKGDSDLLNWWMQMTDVTILAGLGTYRRDFDIILLDPIGLPARTWTVHEAFPVRFKPFSDLNAQSSDNAIEEMEIAHEGFELLG